ncbi:MAG: S-adenosylmethionine:tRNA ribosyltransferase-isomerase, partial [Muribaculaceae bacterium]|nr:S-adenosylmethionine:tRNA ribosyltransferase-isomerase [Muribaculaceae bacterium]
TRVINARLRFRKESGAVIEIFCLEPVSPADYQMNFASTSPVRWKCFVGNSKRWKDGKLSMEVDLGDETVCFCAERISKNDGDSEIEFSWDNKTCSFASIIEKAGEIPIPPYLNRSTEESDLTDYQTIFSRIEGSVAAPTAGLHFTPEVLTRIDEKGITRREVTLHVGAGTFQPVKAPTIGDHAMHSEFIVVERTLIDELAENLRTVVAVGTTSVRTLESLYHIGCKIKTGTWTGVLDQWYPYSEDHPRISVRESLTALSHWLKERGETRLVASTMIIIAPGYEYQIVKRMVTNFHQPGSTLLLLVSAMIGDKWKEIYEHALSENYRFLSYGDACLFSVTSSKN